MRKISYFFVFLLIPAFIVAQNTEGNIFLISGKEYKTRIKGAKEWISNTGDSVLKSGLRIKTDENTSLRIFLNDRFVIFVSADSDINFTKLTDSEELITILKGNILINSAGSKVKGIINTPTAEIIREKPAEILIKVNSQDGNTELIVLREDVSVKNLIQSDNNYKIVKQGTFSKILPQVLPTEPSPFRPADIEDTVKKIKLPFSYSRTSFSDESQFDRFIEEFQFDSFFSGYKNKKGGCKDTYTTTFIPVDFDKNLILRDSVLKINVK
ncbi:MAG: FecR domain-containing protein [Deltaproteobacteria bacterium]|nr:FecR domain-containing protein [Deltaproteobacteria bacterium]